MGAPYRESWRQTAKKGDVVGAGTHYERRETADEWRVDHRFAGDNEIEGGSTLRIGRKIDGSGSNAFGAKEWPYVALEVPLPAGREDLATDLAEELQEVVARFLHDNGLVRP